MAQPENIEIIEKRLWNAADTLRANSNYASNEYFMPVMGLIFLRHAYSRFLGVKTDIEGTLPKRGGKTRELTKEDFSQRTAIFLRPEAQFDTLVNLTDSDDRAQAIIKAMESIEADYEGLRGVLPKSEYQELDNTVLGQLLRTLNPEELKKATGDVFGRIYEYFLTQFADLKAHDNGEFFTPVSLVALIANVIEPAAGTVLDPACGSAGMFVQSAHFVERRNESPSQKLTFRGLEKNPTTIRLAKMNLAVHGLEGDIQKAITYYEDPHELVGKADFVMANPPFNVDEVDADKIKNDPRLPFGLPGVNKGKKVSNGNYLWISYFWSYLNKKGRAGFVMSSQASSGGHGEKDVRRKIVETGDVDVMVSIRSNFFYTRTVPCELWFFDRNKPTHLRNKVLMLDARSVYRKVSRKVNDFSPEQLANLSAVVWLYRGQKDRFLALVKEYLGKVCQECAAIPAAVAAFDKAADTVTATLTVFAKATKGLKDLDAAQKRAFADALAELTETDKAYTADRDLLLKEIDGYRTTTCKSLPADNKGQHAARSAFDPIAERVKGLIKQIDLIYKLAARSVEAAGAIAANKEAAEHLDRRDLSRQIKAMDAIRHGWDDMVSSQPVHRPGAVEQLKAAAYIHRQVAWLQDRFPEAELRDVPGLVKLVERAEIEAADWSLTPGRYVGVAPAEADEDFDFEEALGEIHIELTSLNKEAAALAKQIAKNFEELGV